MANLSITTVTPDPEIAMPVPVKPEEQGIFTKELTRLMYAFGDEDYPLLESINLMECYLLEYIRELMVSAFTRAERRNGQLKLDDILYELRSKPKEYNRVRQLLDKAKKLEKTNKEFVLDEAMPKKRHKNK